MPRTAPVKDQLALMADELGSLEKELLPWKPKLDREKKLRELMRAAVDSKPATLGIEASGERFVVHLGPKALVRSVNVLELAKLISKRAFENLVSCTLAAMERAEINPVIQAQVIESSQTGTRPITITEKGRAA